MRLVLLKQLVKLFYRYIPLRNSLPGKKSSFNSGRKAVN